MPTNTYVALDKVTVSGTSTNSITFSSIPQGYTDLVLICNGGLVSGGQGVRVRFNGDTGSNYSNTELSGTGSVAESARDSNGTNGRLTYDGAWQSTYSGVIKVEVQNYSNTTTYKTWLSRANSTSGVDAVVGLWRSTAAINSITVLLPADNYLSGSTFELYGIRAEGVSPTTKATGGAVYSDSTYYYHVFGASGTFTPTQSITADVLVVAGGGGGGGNKGGGGGAGGLRNGSLSLSATSYTVTVGAGGAGSAATNGPGSNGTDSTISTITSTGGGAGGGGNAAGGTDLNGRNGGSGGGSAWNGTGSPTIGLGNTPSTSPSQGNNGGAVDTVTSAQPGGGGGAGAVGGDGTGATPSRGGNGSSTYSSWGVATGVGQNVSGTYYLAGGGGGGSSSVGYNATGGYGGGGQGGQRSTSDATKGTANTGGGGGGGSTGSSAVAGVAGGSGVVIVRYAK